MPHGVNLLLIERERPGWVLPFNVSNAGVDTRCSHRKPALSVQGSSRSGHTQLDILQVARRIHDRPHDDTGFRVAHFLADDHQIRVGFNAR